jgi:hypothetical protein
MATLINAIILCVWTILLLPKRNGAWPTYNLSVLKQLVNYGMQSVVLILRQSDIEFVKDRVLSGLLKRIKFEMGRSIFL